MSKILQGFPPRSLGKETIKWDKEEKLCRVSPLGPGSSDAFNRAKGENFCRVFPLKSWGIETIKKKKSKILQGFPPRSLEKETIKWGKEEKLCRVSPLGHESSDAFNRAKGENFCRVSPLSHEEKRQSNGQKTKILQGFPPWA